MQLGEVCYTDKECMTKPQEYLRRMLRWEIRGALPFSAMQLIFAASKGMFFKL